MDTNIITIQHLTKRYGSTVALYDLNIDIVRGKIVGLLGPNGCGKTTLIKLLANLLNRYEGKITIDGFEPGVETKNLISYLPDRNYLPDSWDATKAFAFFKDFYPDFNVEKANKLLSRLGIEPSLKFKHMSKGTKEKLQLILVLSRDAKCYLFDEPIAGVDPAARELIFELILENYNKEATVIISTHLIYDVEKILDYAIFLKNGVITRYGEVGQIRRATDKTLEQLFKEDFRC
ncbi:MAG: ABC transporter ATP-binding protein [Bacilli bacterium]|jgi:ABC-2 type transport system ATP-binding protein|nr:ABC transporter ATP-binding protein [Bacilli bacterium]